MKFYASSSKQTNSICILSIHSEVNLEKGQVKNGNFKILINLSCNQPVSIRKHSGILHLPVGKPEISYFFPRDCSLVQSTAARIPST